MAHTCHAKGCSVLVPPKMFMCRRHWYMVPKALRDRVWAAYRPGQEIDKEPTITYMDVEKEAINAVAEKESR